LQQENTSLKAQLNSLTRSSSQPSLASLAPPPLDHLTSSSSMVSSSSSSIGVSVSDASSLVSQLSEKEKQLSRLREVFSGKVSEFRHVVSLLTGWRIDVKGTGEYRVKRSFNNSIETETEEYYLFVKSETGSNSSTNPIPPLSGGMKLVENEWSRRLESNLMTLYQQSKSIPVLLAGLTLAAFQKMNRSK